MADTDVSIRLTAETQQFITEMTRSIQAVDAVRTGLGLLTSVAGALGTAFSVGAIIEWGREVTHAAAELEDLHRVTGSSVESLSRLQNQAKVSGVEFGTLQTLIGRLAAGMAGADDESTKVGQALKFLGISARDPAEALRQVATELEKYTDGVGKAALARDLFGRGGPQMVAMLHDMAQAQAVGATVSREQAEEAQKLEQAIRRMGVEAMTFKDILLSNVVPAIVRWIEMTRLARESGLGWFKALDVGTTYLDQVEPRLARVSGEIQKTKDKMAQLEKQRAVDQGAAGEIEMLKNKLAELVKEYSVLLSMRAQVSAPGNRDALDRFLSGQQGAPVGVREQMTYTGTTPKGEAKARVDELGNALKQIHEMATEADAALTAMFKGEKLTAADRLYAKLSSTEWFTKQSQATQDAIKNALGIVSAEQKQVTAFEDARKAEEEFAKKWQADMESLRSARDEALKAEQDLVEQLKIETDTMMMTTEEKQRYVALQKLDNDQKKEWLKLSDEELAKRKAEIQAAFDARDAAASVKKAADEQRQIWKTTYDQVSQDITDALLRGFESGKSFAQNFRDTLINMFKTLVLKPIIQMIVAPVAGGITSMFSGLAGAGSLAGGGLGNIPGLGSLFGGGGGLGGIGYAMSNPISTLASVFGGSWGPSASIMGPSMAELTGLGSIGAGLSAAIPILGVGALIASLFGGGGAPKGGGSAAIGSLAGTRMFTPSDSDQQIAATLAQFQTDFRSIVSTLGGKPAQLGYALGYDTDPGGTAPNRLSSRLMIGGELVRSVTDLDLGRDSAAIAAALEHDTTQAMIQAIKASDLPEIVSGYWQQVTDATKEQLQALVDASTALEQIDVLKGRNPMQDALDAIAGQTAMGAFTATATALRSLIDNFDNSAAAAKDLSAATQQYYQAEVQLLAQVEQVKQSISDMFGGTVRSMTLATLDKQHQYDYLAAEAARLQEQILTSNDPAQIQQWAEQINQDINAAFGLLSPEEQVANLASFTGNIDTFTAAVNERLNAIETDVQQSASDVLAEVATNLANAAQAMVDAANGMASSSVTEKSAAEAQLQAAATQLEAARTPLVVAFQTTETNFG